MKHKYPHPFIGQKFGNLTVINFNINTKLYELLCECGHSINRIKTVLYGKKPIKSCYRCRRKKEDGQTSYRELYNICKRAAQDRNLDFLLTMEEHTNLIIKKCYCCGNSPTPYNRYLKVDGRRRNRSEFTHDSYVNAAWVTVNGVDRIDSKLGYIKENVAPCCYNCNVGKGEMSLRDYIKHCNKVVEFNKSVPYKETQNGPKQD